jgi:FAD/FMN-containing dehydrogenase
MADPIINFGGNIRFTPRHFYAPRTEDEVLAILDRHAQGKIRVVGALHSWSAAAVSDDALIDLRQFDGVELHTGADGMVSVRVGGGCRIKHLLRKLHALSNVTIPALGLVTEQTIAGAISTATHGSGRQSLSHFVVEVRAAAYDAVIGKARVYVWNDGPELRAARCALGCMGVILSVRMSCVPKYEVAEMIVQCATLDEALAGEDEYPLQQFYLVPHLWSYFAQRRVATPAFRVKRSLGAKLYRVWWFAGVDIGMHLIIKVLVSIFKSPTLTRFFYRRLVTKLILTGVTVTDHSERMLVMEHELFKHLEIEIFVSAKHVRDAASHVRSVLQVFDGASAAATDQVAADLEQIGMGEELRQQRGTFTHHYAITFRRVLPDDTLISMTADAEEPWYAISFITYVEPRDRFFALASFLARSMTQLFDARLHWGKYFPLAGQVVASQYPRLPEFRAICNQIDPNGVFRNEFAQRILFND